MTFIKFVLYRTSVENTSKLVLDQMWQMKSREHIRQNHLRYKSNTIVVPVLNLDMYQEEKKNHRYSRFHCVTTELLSRIQHKVNAHSSETAIYLIKLKAFAFLFKGKSLQEGPNCFSGTYSRISIARTLMARLLWLVRTYKILLTAQKTNI